MLNGKSHSFYGHFQVRKLLGHYQRVSIIISHYKPSLTIITDEFLFAKEICLHQIPEVQET